MKNCGKIVVKEEMGFSSEKRKKVLLKDRDSSHRNYQPNIFFGLVLFVGSGFDFKNNEPRNQCLYVELTSDSNLGLQ